MPLLTNHQQHVLETLHGNAIEVRDIQARLFAEGYKWCPKCRTALPTTRFAPHPHTANYLASRCHTCSRRGGPRHFVELSGPTRLARFYKRNPSSRPTPTRGPYEKTLERRAAGKYVADPLNEGLWLAGTREGTL